MVLTISLFSSTEMTPLEKEQITQAPEFVEFIDRTSKLIERALYVGKAFDITIDYAKRSDEDKYVYYYHPSFLFAFYYSNTR